MTSIFAVIFILLNCNHSSDNNSVKNKYGNKDIHLTENPAKLILFKINGNIQNISDNMDLRKTKKFVIKVESKDTDEYLPATCTYTLTGTKSGINIEVSEFKVFNQDIKNAENNINIENTDASLKSENIKITACAGFVNLTKDNFKIYKNTAENDITSNVKTAGEDIRVENNKIIFLINAVSGQYKEYKKELTIKRKASIKQLQIKSLNIAGEAINGLDINSEVSPSELKKDLSKLKLKGVQINFKGSDGESVIPHRRSKTFSIAKKNGTNIQVLNNNAPIPLQQYIDVFPDGVFRLIIDVKKSTSYGRI